MAAIEIRTGPWGASEIDAFLHDAVIPARLATAGAGGPIVQSMWFVHRDAALWCSTQSSSVLATRLTVDPRVGFEIAGDDPPYRGVRGSGMATLDDSDPEPLLVELIERYLGDGGSLRRRLLARIDGEVSIRIGDLSVVTWDYSRRMA